MHSSKILSSQTGFGKPVLQQIQLILNMVNIDLHRHSLNVLVDMNTGHMTNHVIGHMIDFMTSHSYYCCTTKGRSHSLCPQKNVHNFSLEGSTIFLSAPFS